MTGAVAVETTQANLGASGVAPDEEPVDDQLGDELVIKPLPYTITSYGADYTVDYIARLMREGRILVPEFHRPYVWDLPRASRFIESLLLGLPVPGVFLSRRVETGDLVVIDGQQRLQALQLFHDGFIEGRPFVLAGVQPQYEGLAYSTLRDEDRRRLDEAVLHATIIQQDDPAAEDTWVFDIFERLNTRADQLRPHEVRAAVEYGPFNDLLRRLNDNEAWRGLFGRPSKYMRDQELILRFFALYYDSAEYARPMNEFLNTFMQANRHLGRHDGDTLAGLFTGTVEVIHDGIGRQAFRPTGGRALNAAVCDSVMVGVARRLAAGPLHSPDALRESHAALLQTNGYLEAVGRGTADQELVTRRLQLATDAFGGVA